ncbi:MULTISPECIES: ATP-binding cassette domain-containing protein [Streptomyces]|uniref:ATP-binding cassette domain-containing protein n=1 Tax=Streptomyces TaxID=1883 RepID=UPI001FFE1AF1|nr:ATP-binding cassette domain-containing protein [Streptomyces sp. 4R-3d]
MITFKDLVAGYGRAGDILRGVDFTAAEAAITCVVGPNGAGKSTVLKVCSGLLTPRGGQVTLDGEEIGRLSPARILRQGVVHVPQHHGLFPSLSVRENVLLGAYVRRKERDRNRRRFDEIAEIFPIVAERAAEKAAALSGGQRRIVEFARSLMLSPRVVLLDEPTLGLDPKACALIEESVLRLKEQGVTVLMVEQNVRFGLALADDAVVMEGGRVIHTGPASGLLADPDMAQLFFGGTARTAGADRPDVPEQAGSARLTEIQTLPTSGARAAQPLRIGDEEFLAIPQLAYDIPGTPAHMNGGDSETRLRLLRRAGERFVPWGELAAPGGEDAEFFTIGERAFLAVASIRTGAGPYNYTAPSTVFEWDGEGFAPFQVFDTYAAKQWRHFTVGDRRFLALAQGVAVPGQDQSANRPSVIHEWDGERFVPFQEIPSRWAYNWHAFTVDGAHFLAHADHVSPSVLYRWDGERFTPHQELADTAGRAFATFTGPADGATYLVVARIDDGSRVLRWDAGAGRFVAHQRLAGAGGRELAVVRTPNGLHVVRINFIHGTPADPTTALRSQIYRWDGARLETVLEFPTTGGTDVGVLDDGSASPLLVVTNSLSADRRFAAESVVYRFSG